MKCELVDVFAKQPLSGNGLTIFSQCEHLSTAQMLAWTQEMRQFESIFLCVENGVYRARIFTVEEELDFAGHPLIGLALHLAQRQDTGAAPWQVQLNKQQVTLHCQQDNQGFSATMSQGAPQFINTLSAQSSDVFYRALNLQGAQLAHYPAEVISTGLPYVILPVRGALHNIHYTQGDLSSLLEAQGAKFLYVLDIDLFEGRTWDNQGNIEDIATGSAAGPVAAYLYKHKLLRDSQVIIKQGRFLNRPSEIGVQLRFQAEHISDILVSGHVVKVADINLVEPTTY